MAVEIKVTEILDETFVKEFIRKRPQDGHKGTFGHVLLVAGSPGMTGASVFAARAALRTGSGLVYVAAPKENHAVLQTLVPEGIVVDWEEALANLSGGAGAKRSVHYDAVAFGPGLGLGISVRRKLKNVLLNYNGPIILDADGLNAVSEDEELQGLVRDYCGDIVLTPHPGEAKRLMECSGANWSDDRNYCAAQLAWEYKKIVILKGSHTLVCRSMKESGGMGPGELAENTTGNPGMGTAGSGDVLTGMITSLAGQGLALWDAARVGVWLHGRAGDLAAMQKGEYGMIASDIVEQIPYAIKPFEIENR